MAPVYRVDEHKTSQIAEAPEPTSAKEMAAQRKAELNKNLKDARQRFDRAVEEARMHDKQLAKRDKERLREKMSPKRIKELEAERRKAVRSARIHAEYDLYKAIMSRMAVGSTLPVDEAHKRATAFAEHVIKRSPPGHADVGFIGGDNGYDPMSAYQGLGGYLQPRLKV